MSEAVRTRGQAMRSEVTGGSALAAYQDLVVGSRSIRALLRHEVVASWGAALPGAIGLAFRKFFWAGLFANAANGTVWGRNVTLRHPGKMSIGRGVIVDDDCYLDAKGCGAGEFRIGEHSMISRGCTVSAKGGRLRMGPRVNLGVGCVLYAFEELEIGADTMVAAQCYIGGGRYDSRGATELPMAQQPLPGRGVVIEEDCWIGAGVVVVDGVRIGRGSVIGAGAVVTQDMPPYSIAVGVPARPVASRHPAELVEAR